MLRQSIERPDHPPPDVLPYFVNYKDDYSATITITNLTKAGDVADTMVLNQAFPTNISDITWSWSDRDNFVITPITFSFRDISYTPIRFNQMTGSPLPTPSQLQTLIGLEAINDLLTFAIPRG